MFTETQHRALIDECKEWYNQLADYRQKINKLKEELYFFAPGKSDTEVKKGIEHFHNQFHIQLINIHDIKHEIRPHIQEAEQHPTFGHRIPHHHIKENLDRLIHDLDQLEEEFHAFIRS